MTFGEQTGIIVQRVRVCVLIVASGSSNETSFSINVLTSNVSILLGNLKGAVKNSNLNVNGLSINLSNEMGQIMWFWSISLTPDELAQDDALRNFPGE